MSLSYTFFIFDEVKFFGHVNRGGIETTKHRLLKTHRDVN